MMQGKASYCLRIATLFALALSLVLGFMPAAFTAMRAIHAQAIRAQRAMLGPKAYYLAIGDSLGFGYQPDFNWEAGYASDFYTNLQNHGVTHYDNLACPGETSVTMINGGCPYPFLRKYPYVNSQLQAAVSYLQKYAGQVSPVTLDIGVNDLLPDFNTKDCSIKPQWGSDLAKVDHNLTSVILPQLVAAMTVNGQMTGDLLLMNYYDPYQNLCPATVSAIQTLNAHLAADASGYATMVDIFTPFGGATTPDPHTCTNTWICSTFHDIHAKTAGYSVMAGAFEQTSGY
jgi:lysophospholipase L1-like esterase